MRIRLRTSVISFGLFCLFFIISTSANAQELRKQHWYFGDNNIAIEFTRPDGIPVLITDYKTPPFNQSGKGSASANNPETGDLLFYTDGFEVFDLTYGLMNGSGPGEELDADVSKNQSVAITTAPAQAGVNELYYIFTNTPSGEIHYSEIDITSNGNAQGLQPPLGSVINSARNSLIVNSTANASEGMLIINDDGNGYWLITLDQGSNDYKALHINNPTPVATPWPEIVSLGQGASMDASYIAFNSDSSKIAVAPKNINVNIQLLDFDIATGLITFDKEVPNSGIANDGGTNEAIFDIAFSNDGSKLYYSVYGDGTASNLGALMQFDLFDTTIVLAPQPILPTSVFGSYGLEKGPDNNLYHLYQETSGGPFLIGSLVNINSPANLTTYTPAIENGQDFNAFQFPSFLPNRDPFLSVSFSSSGECSNSPTTFFPVITPAPTSVLWEFGDGSTSTELAPIYTYTAAYAGDVTLTAFIGQASEPISLPISIADFQLQLTLPQDTVACKCELPIYAPIDCTPFSVTVQAQGGSGGETYMWSNGETGATLHPDGPGYYFVVATDGGCSTYAGVEVQEYDTSIPGVAPSSRANIWYFGTKAGIDFTGGASPLDDSVMDAMEGCTAVSDRNGEILFYTDGDLLFDRKHNQIATGLGGTPNASGPAAQSVIAVAVPGDETLFYIFTTENNSGLTGTTYTFSYSLFDLKKQNSFGELGDVINPPVVLFKKSTERITSNGNWVVIHEFGNNNFRAYPLSATGIGEAVVSSIGEDYSANFASNGKGYMKLSGTNLGLAVVEDNQNGITNYLDVFDFDESTGEVSNLRRANLTVEGGIGTAYGIEFVGPKIFVSVRNGASSKLMEYWLDNNGTGDLQIITGIGDPGIEIGAIQTGPDGQVYVAENGNGSLGMIAVNGDTTLPSSYVPAGFPLLPATNSNLGLPNFVQQSGTSGLSPGITVSSPACFGQTIFLTASVTSSIDDVTWQITRPDGSIYPFSSTLLLDSLTIEELPANPPGTYIASVQINNRCLIGEGVPPISYSQPFVISAPPQATDLPPSTFLCGTGTNLNPYLTDPGNIADLDFTWSTGETTQSITVQAEGSYTVLISDRNTSCSISATTFIGPPIPIDVGPDQIICENDPLTLDSQVNADSYIWSINGIGQPGTRFFDLGAQNLVGGTYTIQVDATIDLGGSIGACTVTDQVIITINDAPNFTAEEGGAASCGSTDGTINITSLGSTGSFTYSVAGLTGTITDADALPFTIGTIAAGVPAGVNALTLTNDVTGCTQVENIAVTNPTQFSFTVATAFDESCALNDGSIDYTIVGTVAGFEARAIDISDPTQVFTANETGIGAYSITGIPAGTYTLEIVESATGCIEIWIGNPESDPPVAQQLTINPPVDTDLQIAQDPILRCGISFNFADPDPSTGTIPIGSIDLPGAVLEWSTDPNFASNVNSIATNFTTVGETIVYFRAEAAPSCPVIRQANVLLTPPPTVEIIESGDICNGQLTLTANIIDTGYTGASLGVRWSTGETTQSIIINQTGTYDVIAFHTNNQSCGSAPATFSDPIPESFSVLISSPGPICDNGQPFTLVADVTGSVTNPLFEWFHNGEGNGRSSSSEVYLDAGTYKVIISDVRSNYTCTQEAEFTANLIALTPTELPSAAVFCPDDSVLVLDAGPDFASYLWSTGSAEQSISVNEGGLYELEATNGFGCITTDQTEAIEDCIPVVNGPNAFRPGGTNSTYSLFYKYIDTFEIFIYNRWGELVFTSSEQGFEWDGNTPSGEPAPAGQYTWVARYTSSFRDRGTVEKYGGVMLLR